MKSKIFLNAVLGIGAEVLYAALIMLMALVICLVFNSI